MFGKNRNKKVGLCVMVVTACLVLTALWAVLATPETALAGKPDTPPGQDKEKPGGGGGERTALVTITGPMQTEGESQTFGLGKDNEQTLSVSRGIWTDWGAVPIRYNFALTVAETGNCTCKEGNNWEKGIEVDLLEFDLDDHLVNEEGTFPGRWGVSIVIDMSNLELNEPSETNYKGGHSIDITTDPDQTPTITGTSERLWIPEGPNKSGLVTVTMVEDTGPDSNPRTRVFKFTQFKIQVVSYPSGSQKKEQERKIMRCDNLDDAITVTVETTL